uniref:(northern house mosquito) hypothetical protein n=1 Tax=Culex pipiens TaxID=7175 RepID=A0A8D8FUB6_CULPI
MTGMFSRTPILMATSTLMKRIVCGARRVRLTLEGASVLIRTATGAFTGLNREHQTVVHQKPTVDRVRSRKSRPRPCPTTLLRSREKSKPTSDSTRTPSFYCTRTDTLKSTRRTTMT